MPTARQLSRDTDHMSEDLAASLRAAGVDDTFAAGAFEDNTPHRVLEDVLETFGKPVFGAVLRFHMEAKTSLSGTCEVASTSRSLAILGLTVADLGWPAEILHPVYFRAASPADPAIEEQLRAAVEEWKAAHPE